jgi:hypothetical protein
MIENPKLDTFLNAVWKLCEKHGFALSHEDKHGAFEIVTLQSGSREWLMDCHDDTGEKQVSGKNDEK